MAKFLECNLLSMEVALTLIETYSGDSVHIIIIFTKRLEEIAHSSWNTFKVT